MCHAALYRNHLTKVAGAFTGISLSSGVRVESGNRQAKRSRERSVSGLRWAAFVLPSRDLQTLDRWSQGRGRDRYVQGGFCGSQARECQHRRQSALAKAGDWVEAKRPRVRHHSRGEVPVEGRAPPRPWTRC